MTEQQLAAVKQALEALKELNINASDYDFGPAYEGAKQRRKTAITSLRQAIAEAEQADSVVGTKTWFDGDKLVQKKIKHSDVYKQHDDVLRYATRLAWAIWRKHYASDAPNWKPFDDVMGLLTQIDNMASGLVRPQQALVQPKTKPAQEMLTDDLWILTSEYNDYDQYGEYFIEAFIGKPTTEQIQTLCEVDKTDADRILSGGGRHDGEYVWYNLNKHEAAHGITQQVEQA